MKRPPRTRPGAVPRDSPVIRERILSFAARRRRLRTAAGLTAILAVASWLPATRPLPFEICLLHGLTGLPCLTCGLTRSVCLLMQGDPAASFAMHPAGLPAVVLMALQVLWRGCEASTGRRLTLGS